MLYVLVIYTPHSEKKLKPAIFTHRFYKTSKKDTQTKFVVSSGTLDIVPRFSLQQNLLKGVGAPDG